MSQTVVLGIRIAFAGGRESVFRVALMATGVAVGVTLLLFSLTGMPALQGRIDRYAWHRTDASTPATAPDPALWLAVTDRYAGQNVIRVHIAALGPNPPRPPGVQRLPGPGEVLVSPALAELFRAVPGDQLRDRFPGRVVGTIGRDGLVSPRELVGIVGRTPDELRATVGAYQIRGFEPPGEAIDLGPILRVMFTIVTVFLIGPVVVFVAMVTRVGAARREQRFAAIRLAGATRWQTGVLAATESAVAATMGALVGLGGYLLVRPVVADHITIEGIPFPLEDLAAPPGQVGMVLGIVPLVAVASTLIALNRVRITPLGAARRGRRRPPQLWRLAPLTAGILGMVEVARLSRRDDPAGFGLLEFLSLAAPLSILVGLVLAGPWVCMWGARGLARLSRRATTLIAARRIASDPYTAFRAVSGVALASFVATLFGLGAASQTGDSGRPTPLDPGVLAIHVEGAPGAALAPLLAGDVVVARSGPVRSLVVACTDLANVTDLTCPRPPDETVPLDSLFRPERFLEPGLNAAELPIATIFVRTDGTPAAEERVRTLAATIAPHALTRSYRDYDPAGHPQPIADELSEGALNWLNEGFVLVLAFVLLVAACSLTIAVVSGLMERRRPFALLRASGVRLGELRHIVMLESAVALVCTVLAGMGTALLAAAVVVPTDRWVLPSVWFFVILATATAVAFAVTTIALPLTNRMTGHDSVRFE